MGYVDAQGRLLGRVVSIPCPDENAVRVGSAGQRERGGGGGGREGGGGGGAAEGILTREVRQERER